MTERRKELGLSQEELASSVGITKQTINLIEKSSYNPSLKVFSGIAKALNTSMDDLFGSDDDEINLL